MKLTKLYLLVVLSLASCAKPSALVPTLTLSPQPTTTQTPLPTPTTTPAPTKVGGGSGRFIFELEKAEFAKIYPDLKGNLNVFIANADGTDLIPVTNGLKGYNYIESISPDGTKALIATGSDEYFEKEKDPNLYAINLNSLESEPVKLAGGLDKDAWGGSIAKWLNDKNLAYIGQGENGFGIYTVKSDGTNLSNIYKYNNDGAAHKPAELLAVTDSRVYWDSAITTSLGGNKANTKNFAWWSSTDGSEQGTLEFNGKQIIFDSNFNPLVFSRDGSEVAWVEPATATFHHNYLHIASASAMDKANQLDILSSFPIIRWWPDGSKILVFDDDSVRMQQVEKLDPTNDLFGLYVVTISPSLVVRNEHLSNVLDILVPPESRGYGSYCLDGIGDFSPDGQHILIYLPDNNCNWKANLLDMGTMSFSKLFTNFRAFDIHWLP